MKAIYDSGLEIQTKNPLGPYAKTMDLLNQNLRKMSQGRDRLTNPPEEDQKVNPQYGHQLCCREEVINYVLMGKTQTDQIMWKQSIY